MNWTKTEPGVLALEGTDFRIVYRPGSKGGDFHIYQGERFRYACATLAYAKGDAQRLQTEIEEIS